MNIKTKMLTYILLTTILIFAFSVGYMSINTQNIILTDAENNAMNVVKANALKVEKSLAEDLSSVRTLAQVFALYDDLDEDVWKSLFSKMAYEVFVKNNNFFGFSGSWETQYYDSLWTGEPTRYFLHFEKRNGKIAQSASVKDLSSTVYQKAKKANQDMVMEATKSDERNTMMSFLASPIHKNSDFAGYVVADIISSRFKNIILSIKPWEYTKTYLVANDGSLLWYPDEGFLGKTIYDYNPGFEDQFNLSKNIIGGEPGIFRGVDEDNNRILVAVAPIQVGEYKSPWALALVVPINVVLKEANKAQLISLVVAIIGIILISLIIFTISNKISSNILSSTVTLKRLSKGDIENFDDLVINGASELEDMAYSVNTLKNGLRETSVFAEKIGKGNLEASFNPLSDKDILGNSLLNMRKSLQHAEAEEKKRKIEDEKQNWSTQGLAKFGEILRANADNMEALSYNIISNLINYLKINQGALFVVDDSVDKDDGVFLELKAAVAYGRDKYMNKRIAVGESMVGRCAFEKKAIYITDLPPDYINITSGMGGANPSALLLVPLVLNDDIFGVIELASFNTIEGYQMEFVERLGEIIASTIASVKVNEKTTLLLEQSKTQAEELAAQEEEMRQNLEELQATQEEAARREYDMARVIEALGNTAFITEYDLDGTILSCNEKYADVLGMDRNEIIGTNHRDGYDFTPEMESNYDILWGDLLRGDTKKEVVKINFNNKELWLEETYTPIYTDNEKKPYKILKIAFDVSELKSKEMVIQELEKKINEGKKMFDEKHNNINELRDQLARALDEIRLLKRDR